MVFDFSSLNCKITKTQIGVNVRQERSNQCANFQVIKIGGQRHNMSALRTSGPT